MSMAASEEKEPEEAQPAVYDELHRLAGTLKHQLRPGQMLQVAALGWLRRRDSSMTCVLSLRPPCPSPFYA